MVEQNSPQIASIDGVDGSEMLREEFNALWVEQNSAVTLVIGIDERVERGIFVSKHFHEARLSGLIELGEDVSS